MRVYSEFPDQHGSLTWFPYTAVPSTPNRRTSETPISTSFGEQSWNR
jgi:hypothetical protein